jgi:hypothetical protein
MVMDRAVKAGYKMEKFFEDIFHREYKKETKT